MTTAANKALVRRLYTEVFNNRNLYLIEELVAENFVDHNPEPGAGPNRDSIKPMILGFVEAFPDFNLRVQSIVCEGDRVGAFIEATGTHLGTFAGAPATGNPVRITGFDWCRIENNQIAERWGVFDMATMMQQVGLAPNPPAAELKKLSARYFEVLDGAKGDLAALRNEFFAPTCRHTFSGETLTTTDLQSVAQMFWAAFPDIKHTVVSQICEGNWVFNHNRVACTHKGEFAGVKATNKKLDVEVMVAQRWEGGRIVEELVNIDMTSLLVQIGAMPKPGN